MTQPQLHNRLLAPDALALHACAMARREQTITIRHPSALLTVPEAVLRASAASGKLGAAFEARSSQCIDGTAAMLQVNECSLESLHAFLELCCHAARRGSPLSRLGVVRQGQRAMDLILRYEAAALLAVIREAQLGFLRKYL